MSALIPTNYIQTKVTPHTPTQKTNKLSRLITGEYYHYYCGREWLSINKIIIIMDCFIPISTDDGGDSNYNYILCANNKVY